MSSTPDFNGSESPSEIAAAAIEWFSHQRHDAHFLIFHEDSIPKMKYTLDIGWVEFECVYRLDRLLEAFYTDAQQIFDENARVGFVEPDLRELLVPMIAFAGMTAILGRLVILQAQIFQDTFEEIRVTTSGMFLHSLVTQSPHKTSLGRGASKIVQDWIDQAVDAAMRKKRDYLVNYMNTHPLLNIPTGVGRPRGSTKSEEKKAKDKAEFEARIEETIRALYTATGTFPTKTAVAESLSISPNALRIFIAKTNRLNIDYEALAERVKGSLIN